MNLMGPLVECAIVYCTVGEIVAELKDVWGEFRPACRLSEEPWVPHGLRGEIDVTRVRSQGIRVVDLCQVLAGPYATLDPRRRSAPT